MGVGAGVAVAGSVGTVPEVVALLSRAVSIAGCWRFGPVVSPGSMMLSRMSEGSSAPTVVARTCTSSTSPTTTASVPAR